MSWINQKINQLESKIKWIKIVNYVFFVVVCAINLTVMGLSAWALYILLNYQIDYPQNDLTFSIVMSSLAAGVNLLIFIFTIFNLTYRKNMKYNDYKVAIYQIQSEYMNFCLTTKKASKRERSRKWEELEAKVSIIFEQAIASKRKPSVSNLSKTILKVVEKGQNA